MPPRFSYKTDSKEDADKRASPVETAQDLQKQEQQSGYDRDFDELTDPKNIAKDGKSGDLSGGGVKDAEEKGGWDNRVSSSYGGNKSEKGRFISGANFRAILKKRGPLTAILAVLFGGGLGVGIFLSPSLLLIHIQEAFVDKFDTQNTSLTIRSNKILANKLTESSTTGSCNVVKIACRFSRPSNKLLKNLETNGVLARNANGDLISRKDGLFQTERPAKYTFKGEEISAKDFSKVLANNSDFRAAFHRAYSPRFFGFSDAVYKTIQTRFGFDKTNKLSKATDIDTIKETINDASKGSDIGAKAAGEGGEEVSQKFLEKLITGRGTKALDTLAKSGKGSATTLVAGAVCIATDIPSSVIAITRAYQMAQLIKYSAVFLSSASAMKASDPSFTPETASAFGAILTTTVAGKSPMDSDGMKNALYGDTAVTSNSYKKYIPGSGAVSLLGGINQLTSSKETKEACDVALNPITGAALNATLVAAGGATFGATAVAALINLTAGFALSQVITAVAPTLITALMPLLQPAMSGLLGLLLGDVTTNLAGADAGDALASGASHLMGQTASAGGNVPLTVNQAVAYQSTTQDVQLAYAQEDRATLSPLDASNKNTFLGSIVNNLLPYYSEISSVSGLLKTVGSVPFMSLSSLLKPSSANAADTAAQFSTCDDPSIKNTGTAAGFFCNVEYGIPTEYLNMDPQDVVNQLIASGDINENTGEPVDKGDESSSLKGWMDLCTDGSTDQLASCKIDKDKDPEGARLMSLYAIYTIDHRVQVSMDEELTDSPTGTGTDITDKKVLAQKIVDKNKVKYLGDVQPILADIASGKVDASAEPCGININILKIIDVITDSHTITISDINRQCTGSLASSTGSRHYAGNGSALDIAVIDGVATNGRDANAVKVIDLAMPILTSAAADAKSYSQVGQVQCGTSVTLGASVRTFNDSCNHVHLDVPAKSDPNLKYSPGW